MMNRAIGTSTKDIHSTDSDSKSMVSPAVQKLLNLYVNNIECLKLKMGKLEKKIQEKAFRGSLGWIASRLSNTRKDILRMSFGRIRQQASIKAIPRRQNHIPLGHFQPIINQQWPSIDRFINSPAQQCTSDTKTLKLLKTLNLLEVKRKRQFFNLLQSLKLGNPFLSTQRQLRNLSDLIQHQLPLVCSKSQPLIEKQTVINGILQQNCRLWIQINKANQKIENLKKQVEFRNRQIEQVNIQKIQSLQAIAQELLQKQEQLIILRQQLCQYENIVPVGPVFTESQYRIEIDKLQEQNHRLSDEIFYMTADHKQQVKKLKKQLSELEGCPAIIKQLQAKIQELHAQKFDVEYRCKMAEESNKILEETNKQLIEKSSTNDSIMLTFSKIHRLCANNRTADEKIKQIRKMVELSSDRSDDEQLLSIIEQMIDDGKPILDDFDVKIKNKLHDIENKLKNLKQKDSISRCQSTKTERFLSQPSLFDSVVLDSQMVRSESSPVNVKNSERQKLEKMVEETKDRLMHVRNLLFQLLKSIDTRKITKDTVFIVDILSNVLEYSESQKMEMLPVPQKTFLNLFM